LERIEARGRGVDLSVDDAHRPILLAVSDNGPQMTSGSTREFMALCAIAQHFGRPGTPTDQAWIESLFGHVKADWPHLDRIDDPAVFEGQFVPKSSDTELFGTNIGRAAPYPPAMSPKTPGGTECFGRQRAVRGLGSLFGGIFVTAWFPRRHTQGSAIASRRVRHDRWVQMREHEWPWEGWLSWP